jgi:hypothetical protein
LDCTNLLPSLSKWSMDSTSRTSSNSISPKGASAVEVAAGRLTALFDPATGFLRYVRSGQDEIVRAIYAAVRDHNWNTIRPQFSGISIERSDQSFRVTFNASSNKEPVHFEWSAIIQGEDNRIVYTFEGEAKSAFLKNRIGLCVLHPLLECAGKECTVEHTDGTFEKGEFPKYISPNEPFRDIRAIYYPVPSGGSVEVRFEGETFEMEDQRNWTDGSFKTYSTPQALPKPVKVTPGHRVSHRVTISFSEGQTRSAQTQAAVPQLILSATPMLPKPSLGFCIGEETDLLSGESIKRLEMIRPSHLRIDVDFRKSTWRIRFAEGAKISRLIGAPLHVGLLLGAAIEENLAQLLELAGQLDPHIKLWMLFHEKENPVSQAAARVAEPILLKFNSNVLIAVGGRESFVDLNRNRPSSGAGTLPVYSISPQIHSIDEMSMIENLDGQAPTVETAYQFSKQIVVVSAITLLPAEFPLGMDNPPADPRQKSLFAAAWTLGSLSRLVGSPQLHSLTYYRAAGPHGLMSESGVFPVWHVFRDIAEFGRIFPTRSTRPLQVAGLSLIDDREKRRLLVANLVSSHQTVSVVAGTRKGRVRYLDESTLQQAQREPETFYRENGERIEPAAGLLNLSLAPYALARIDFE